MEGTTTGTTGPAPMETRYAKGKKPHASAPARCVFTLGTGALYDPAEAEVRANEAISAAENYDREVGNSLGGPSLVDDTVINFRRLLKPTARRPTGRIRKKGAGETSSEVGNRLYYTWACTPEPERLCPRSMCDSILQNTTADGKTCFSKECTRPVRKRCMRCKRAYCNYHAQ
eukprot:gene18036-806_t